MRLGAYYAVLTPGHQGARRLRRAGRVASATVTATSSTTPTGRRFEGAGFVLSGTSPDGRLVEFIELADHPFWVGTQAHPEFKSRPDRPAPAVPRARRARRWRGAEGRNPHLIPLRRGEPVAESRAAEPRRDRPAVGFRRRRRARSSTRGHLWRVVGRRRSRRPTASAFERDVVRSPGAVGVVPVLFDAEGTPSVVLVRQYRAALDARAARDPGRACATSTASRPRTTARRELAEEVGLAAGRLELLTVFHNSAGHDRRRPPTSSSATGLTPVPPRPPTGPRRRHMTVVQRPAGRRRAPRSRAGDHHRRQDRHRAAARRPSASTAWRDDRRRPPCRLPAEEFLTWLAVERGRSRQHPGRLPARPPRLHGRGWPSAGRRLDDGRRGRRGRATSPHLRAAGGRPASVARAAGRGADAAPLPRRRGRRRRRPGRRRGPAARAGRAAQAARPRPRSTALLDAVVGDDAGRTAATGRILELLYGTGHAHLRAVRAVARRPRPRRRDWCGCSARDPRSGSCRSGGRRARRLARLARPRRPGARWCRRGGPAATTPRRCSSTSGAAACPARGRGRSCAAYGDAVGLAGAAVAPRAAPLVRHPHARPRRRHPRRAGAARARVDLDDAGVHAGVDRAAAGRVRRRPPPGPPAVTAA